MRSAIPRGKRRAPDRKAERDFDGEKRRSQTHASTTDPEARLYRKGPGQPAKLAYLGHFLDGEPACSVCRHRLTQATGTAEREAALAMVAPRPGTRWVPIRAYDTGEFVSNLRQHHVTPHVAQNLTNRRSAIDARTTRHPGVEREELELG